MSQTQTTTEMRPRPASPLRALAPEIPRAFGAMFQSLMRDGALSGREKELIALGIAVAVHCEPCIESHVEKCRHAGATDAQMLEAAGVGVVMGGGPAYTHAAKVAELLGRSAASPRTTAA